MGFIKLGKIDKKFLIPVLGGVLMLVYRFLIGLNPKYEITGKNPFIFNIYASFGMIFAFIPYLILKHKNKPSSNSETQIESKLDSDFNRTEKLLDNRYLKLKLIIYSTIFDFSQSLLSTLICYYCIYNIWIFDIALMSLFSYIILKTKLYRHQYISMIIIIIFGLLLNIVAHLKLSDEDKKIDYKEILCKIFCEVCYSIGMVISKYNMQKTYCTPYEICFWQGIPEVILNIIVLIILNKLGLEILDIKYPDNFMNYLIIMIYMILLYF